LTNDDIVLNKRPVFGGRSIIDYDTVLTPIDYFGIVRDPIPLLVMMMAW